MLEKIKAFIAVRTGISQEKLSEETTIESGVGIAGYDTLEFYQTFFKEFEIENVEDFNANQYISSENFNPFGAFLRLFSKSFREEHSIKEVPIKHLVKVAEQKRWFDVN